MSDSVEIPMTLPLDADGFLRRECPTCEREFKWLPSPENEQSPTPEGGYYCPYCAIQGPADSWWTKPQLEHVKSLAYSEIVAPELKKFADDLARHKPTTGSGIGITFDMEAPDVVDPEPLEEPDDMVRVDFECHPREPVKVIEAWSAPAHCLLCGQPANRP